MSKSSITAQGVGELPSKYTSASNRFCYFEKPRHLLSKIKTKLKAKLNIDAVSSRLRDMPSDVDILSFAHNLRLYSFIKTMVRAVTLITVYDRPLGTWTTTNPPTNVSSKKDIADKIKKDKAFPDRGNDLFEAAGGSLHVHHNQQDPQIKGEPTTD
ncbi:hypothetical protein D6D20_02519 [Aureobasidium pullulans]|uniref:Uncharacterized protein n=1 Tax=Aureobasidium pullulans TaxID=5580 RepID=A0A4S8ZG94_AURPU|nr:hypothetical protein D6D20_02519 [Aureobasidium pullulans]